MHNYIWMRVSYASVFYLAQLRSLAQMRAISHTFAQLRVTDFRLETQIWIIELDQGWKFLTEKVDLIH